MAAAVVAALAAWLGAVYVVPAAQLGQSWTEIDRVSLDDTRGTASAADTPSTSSSEDSRVDAPVPDTGAAPATSTSRSSTATASRDGSGRSSSDSSRSSEAGGSASPTTQPATTATATSGTKTDNKRRGAASVGETGASTTTSTVAALTSTVPDDEVPDTVLLVGSDARTGVDGDENFGSFEGERADVIVLVLVDRDEITLVSIPRDLAVTDTCHGGTHKIGEAFEGCEGSHGLSHLASEVAAVTGVGIDHAAAMEMAGFQKAVDAVGGYEICAAHPLRDQEAGLDIPAGCEVADGETTLAWIRSRHTERLVDGRWEPYPAVSDLVRNERQREFLVDMLHRIGNDLSVDQLLEVGQDVAQHLTIDDALSLRDVVRLGWQFRESDVSIVEIPVVDETLSDGSAALRATKDPAEVVAEVG